MHVALLAAGFVACFLAGWCYNQYAATGPAGFTNAQTLSAEKVVKSDLVGRVKEDVKRGWGGFWKMSWADVVMVLVWKVRWRAETSLLGVGITCGMWACWLVRRYNRLYWF
jgi:hypothetical protein